MSSSCMQAIKQQLEAMPLEEFENLLKGVAVNKGHEGMPQHAELLSQLKHHVKVQMDEPIQTKVSDKDCRTICNSLNQRDKSHRLSNSSSSSGGVSGCGNINGNLESSGNHNSHYSYHKPNPLSFPSNSLGRTLPTGDQNANPVTSTSDSSSNVYCHQPVQNSIQGKYQDYSNNHHQFHHSTLAYGNSLDGDPGGSSRHSQERDSQNNDNTITPIDKGYCVEDDDQDDDDDKPEEYTGTLPAQYILPSVTKYNSCKELPFFNKPTSNSQSGATSTQSVRDTSPASSSTSWDTQSVQLQLNDGYKSVASVTSGAASYAGKAVSSPNEATYGTIQAMSPPPTPCPSATASKSPPIDGSQSEKQTTRRGADRKKKTSKNVLRETLINPEKMPGYKGNEDIEKLLQFVEGNQNKTKKLSKDKKAKESKPKGNEKQVLSKAASLDENSLGYGSKKSDESMPRNRNSKEVEKKNSTNITKSATAICTENITDSPANNFTIAHEQTPSPSGANNNKPATPAPLVNGTVSVGSKVAAVNPSPQPSSSAKPIGLPKPQIEVDKSDVSQAAGVASTSKSDVPVTSLQLIPEPKQEKAPVEKKNDDERTKPDESDGPYVLVQKKKREKKKGQQRESARENFARTHPDQARRESGRPRRGNAERRKSVGSVPGSENSECSDDDDSVRSLPAGECTPRERIPKPCSSSGGTPQTSYADIARMSRDETGKVTASPPISLPQPTIAISAKPPTSVKPPQTPTPTPAAVTSDSNFPALSPPNPDKTVSVGTAVWPCRPRTEPEVQIKDKSLNSKADDTPLPKEASASQIGTNLSESLSCSTKLLIESKESNSLGKTSIDVLDAKESTLSNLSSENTSSVVASQNVGTVPLSSNCSVDGAQAPVFSTSKAAPHGMRSNSLKNCLQKVADESSSKTASLKVENGDFVIHATEPVVFCGGKFDSSHLPAGQKIGFEFGFGVIEALNDNGSTTDNASIRIGSIDCPVATPQQSAGGPAGTVDRNRSQDRPASASNNHGIQLEKTLAKKELILKSNETQTRTKITSTKHKTSGSLTGDQSTNLFVHPVAGDMPSEPTKVQTTGKEKSEISSGDVPSKVEMSTTNNAAPTGNEVMGKSQNKIDIAQMYVSPKCSTVYESFHSVMEFMDNYATRLSTMHKEGKVSYLRI